MTGAATLDALLPQLQCGRCGYGACAPYAQALADGRARADRCGPGGQAVADALAAALGRAPLVPDPACGEPLPAQWAWIDPQECIGCARCLPACPVDAIVGARKRLHAIVPAQCTGCALCVPVCPVDCIELRPLPDAERTPARRHARARLSAARYRSRNARLRLVPPEPVAPADARPPAPPTAPPAQGGAGKSPEVLDALARAREIVAAMRAGPAQERP